MNQMILVIFVRNAQNLCSNLQKDWVHSAASPIDVHLGVLPVILGEQIRLKDIAIGSRICNSEHYSHAFALNDLQSSLFAIVCTRPRLRLVVFPVSSDVGRWLSFRTGTPRFDHYRR